MPSTLTYGQKIPSSGERGTSNFTCLSDNFTRLDSHAHDGITSPKIDPKNLSKQTTTLALASWAAVASQTGTYRQLLTVPSGYECDSAIMKFYVGSGSEAGMPCYLHFEKVSSTTGYVYINDNTIDVKVTYG